MLVCPFDPFGKVVHAMLPWVLSGRERCPGTRRKRKNGRIQFAVNAQVYHLREIRELALLEERPDQVKGCTVKADNQNFRKKSITHSKTSPTDFSIDTADSIRLKSFP